jgi:heme-degrading monooxygenase HmoA
MNQPSTLGIFTIKQGKDKEFIENWHKAVEFTMSQYKISGDGPRLYQDSNNPRVYYSYGIWNNMNDINTWREQTEDSEFMRTFRDLCDNVERHVLKFVAEVPVGQKQKVGTRQ